MRVGDCRRKNFCYGTKDILEKSVRKGVPLILVVLPLGGLVASCSTEKNANLPKIEETDQFKIDRAVYSYMLQRHFWAEGEYSAIFLQGEDAEVSAVSRQFPGIVPPIKPSYRADLHANRTPLDKDSGRPAMIFSVDVLETTNALTEAIGRWYAGPAVSGFYTFELKKTGDDWLVQSVH